MEREQVRERLEQLAEPGYQQFTARLLPGTERILGIRLPALRRLAKEIAGEDWAGCLAWKEPLLFEERMLQAFCIGYGKAGLEEILAAAEQFIPTIDNWSVNDSFCASFKIARKYPREVWDFLMGYRASDKEFEGRTVAVMLMDHYLTPEYISQALEVLGGLPVSGYYASMGIAWAYATAWAKFPRETREYLLAHKIDQATYHRTLQKCLESYRISDEDKEWIRGQRERKGKGQENADRS